MSDLDLRIDFTEIDDSVVEYKPVPPSKQRVMITDWDQGVTGEKSQNPGSPKLTFELTIQDDEYAGRRIWDVFTFGEKSLWKIKGFMNAVGAETGKAWTIGEILEEAPEWVGKELVVRLAIQPARRDPNTGNEYQARNQVKAYFPSEGGSDLP